MIVSMSFSITGCTDASPVTSPVTSPKIESTASAIPLTQTLTSGSTNSIQSNAASEPVSEEAEVRKLVEKFGQQLKMVSLLADAETVKSDLKKYYGDLVSPNLLSKWEADVLNAPGRLVSSPWPDRIEIRLVLKNDNEEYLAAGDIIEITSGQEQSGKDTVRKPVTLTLEKLNGQWVITDFSEDAGEVNSLGYQNHEFGLDVKLPGSWKGFTVVSQEWEGTPMNGAGTNQAVLTGPLLLVRHPLWTSAKPRQDIPVMVFTLVQWKELKDGKFHIGAAPVNPRALARNSRYVFALQARYNYAFPAGFEEVEEILNNNSVSAAENFTEAAPVK